MIYDVSKGTNHLRIKLLSASHIFSADVSFEGIAEKCCRESTVPQVCLGLCKDQDTNLGNRAGKFNIFGISNLGRCSKHLEAIQNCRSKGS